MFAKMDSNSIWTISKLYNKQYQDECLDNCPAGYGEFNNICVSNIYSNLKEIDNCAELESATTCKTCNSGFYPNGDKTICSSNRIIIYRLWFSLQNMFIK